MCKISVIIPVYNVELYLSQCLDSVLGQSFMDIEVICVEDCSTDDSLNILYRYQENDRRIRILKNDENRGLSISRNRGLRAARGKYIYFLDSDDWLVPDALYILWKKAEYYNYSLDVVLFNSKIIAEEKGLGGTSVDWGMENLYETVMSGQSAFCSVIEKNKWSSAVWRQFWRREFLEFNGIVFENKTRAEDWIFTTEALLNAEKVIFINNILHNYRRHKQSLSFVHDTEMLKCYAQNYMSMLRYWLSHDFSQRTNYFIKIHMDNLVQRIRNLNVQYSDVSTNEMFDELVDQHLFQLITKSNSQTFLEQDVDRSFVDSLQNYKYVYIYGASGYAIEMYEQLKLWGIDICGFVVTGYTKAQNIYGHPVYKIDDVSSDEDCTVFVLGITEKNRKDVIDYLAKHGFENYISL